MENLIWIEKEQILQKSKNRNIVFWGSGAWVEKTMNYLGINPQFIIDNNHNIQGHIQRGIKIISPNEIILKEYLIIITTGSYHQLIRDLQEKGLIPGVNFVCTPILKNLKIRDTMLNIDKNILYSVPLPPQDGGGLYIYNTLNRKSNLLFQGKARALSKSKNYIALVDELEGLILFDHNLNIVKRISLLSNSIPHGIAISEKLNKIFVANSGRDSISIFDLATENHIEEIRISDKYEKLSEEQHHLNDLYVNSEEETLFISMFSFTGNWRKNVYDGGILEYDLRNQKFNGPIIENMWMPHSIQVMGDQIIFLDSMRGNLYKTNNNIIGQFQGFVRGLDYDNDFFYIAQSAHRYFDRLKDIALNIPLNCGIHIFDETTKASVFHSLPEIENIHSLLLLK